MRYEQGWYAVIVQAFWLLLIVAFHTAAARQKNRDATRVAYRIWLLASLGLLPPLVGLPGSLARLPIRLAAPLGPIGLEGLWLVTGFWIWWVAIGAWIISWNCEIITYSLVMTLLQRGTDMDGRAEKARQRMSELKSWQKGFRWVAGLWAMVWLPAVAAVVFALL